MAFSNVGRWWIWWHGGLGELERGERSGLGGGGTFSSVYERYRERCVNLSSVIDSNYVRNLAVFESLLLLYNCRTFPGAVGSVEGYSRWRRSLSVVFREAGGFPGDCVGEKEPKQEVNNFL